jgi:hypothetical protein
VGRFHFEEYRPIERYGIQVGKVCVEAEEVSGKTRHSKLEMQISLMVKQLREDGRGIYSVDETWVDANIAFRKCWQRQRECSEYYRDGQCCQHTHACAHWPFNKFSESERKRAQMWVITTAK